MLYIALCFCGPARRSFSVGGYRIVAIISGFQPDDTGSTPVTRSFTGRSLVGLKRCVWDAEIAGSNPVAPIYENFIIFNHNRQLIFAFSS